MKSRILIILFLTYLTTGNIFAQKGVIDKADKAYKDFGYIKTTEILLRLAEKGYESEELFQKLGDAFYFNSKMDEAVRWYGKLMNFSISVDPEYFFRYAQALKSVENYKESDKWMQKFYDAKSYDTRGQYFTKAVDYLTMIDGLSRDFKVYNLDINSEVSDFGTTFWGDKMIFASARDNGKIYKWNNQPFLQLYSATEKSFDSFEDAKIFQNNLNTKYHESSVAFTPDKKFMFFTRNNFFENKLKNDEEGTNRLSLFRARYNDADGTWVDVTPVHFNSNSYSVAHPTINADGTKLYFSSDMNRTIGLSDIFVTEISVDGTLGEPQNLGTKINTEGQDTFPFINAKGDLYFSSNGYPGLGGLDVYVVRGFENGNKGKESVPENLGKPINSPLDDFAYYENLETKEGFFSSNRKGGKGDDDIYTFIIPNCLQTLTGVVVEKKTHKNIPFATVILLDETGRELSKIKTNEEARFSIDLDCEKEYLVRGESNKYIADEKRIVTPNLKQDLKIILELEKEQQEIKVGDDLAKILDIPIIYFDFDKSDIRQDAALELQKIVEVLKQYPNMTIDVRSHTDSRGADAYNLTLSEKRNKSTKDFIVKKAQIDRGRITGKGYGETRLVNKCSNGVPCTEEEHQENRRSEFIITKM
ncbi:OmpA family protein [Gaetbulibacter sp. M235]|uniref:OmpA family protein n=1 Tax=Gaetbulibacter sp. M235 TaxID=3126510 RepID=UPI00374F7187